MVAEEAGETLDPRAPIATSAGRRRARRGHEVILDTLVAAFREGRTAEEIREQYSSLDLAGVCGAISYDLHHQAEVVAYLEERSKLGREVRAERERRFAGQGLRQRLVPRRRP